jgi:(S)-ureidoglycine aminohydrolase
MTLSRRDLGLIVPLLAATAKGQTAGTELLPPKNYHSDQIPYTGDATKKGRRFFYGVTHGGFRLEMHETILGKGVETHPPHKHVHEEIIIVVEGKLETHVEGKTDVVETGSVIYFGSNQLHNARNAGETPCRYYVIELRGDEA